MISYFGYKEDWIYVVGHHHPLEDTAVERLTWLLGCGEIPEEPQGSFIGPRKEMVTPWSTNAVEITQNMGIAGIFRIEEFRKEKPGVPFDKMLQQRYQGIDRNVFTVDHIPEPVRYIDDIAGYNRQEGLALSTEEVEYLTGLSHRIGRKLTDSEVFGFSQVNSEHCRHKIFNGTFVIDGEEKPWSLFDHIKRTTRENRNRVVSAYKDNVAFIAGPSIREFAPERQDVPAFFRLSDRESVISLKAETHNFPTTVEPFNGAATGTGGEIRDRLAGGKGSLPIAGTAVYMTSYPRSEEGRNWESDKLTARPWLYQTPQEILIKASNGASDFGNKFGQPLICGSLLTFEYQDDTELYGYDKVIMLAGGVGYGYLKDAEKDVPVPGDLIVVLGGDNYRIGMGGGAVSSVATGEFSNSIELNAVQRSNPEMQKRVANAIRAMVEAGVNPVVAIHDHGAGGHLNSLSELVEATGGEIDITKLPVGDPTLSAREIIGNESQERMGLIIHPGDLRLLQQVAERERAPMYVVGRVTGNHRLLFSGPGTETTPIDLELADLFGKPPRTVLEDTTLPRDRESVPVMPELQQALEAVLQLESVACKDWLTNKVDRSVTGRVALQQCTGELQLPLNNLAVVALDYTGKAGIATSIGHAPAAALIDPAAGSRLAVAEALTNLVWAPLTHGLAGVSLSANWMWPCRNPGEDARLYEAVEAVSDFCVALGINIPTGKDSLSMTQKYPDGSKVIGPGTVIISSVAEVDDITHCITPDLKPVPESLLIHIDFSVNNLALGGSAYSQVMQELGSDTPDVTPETLKKGFGLVQAMIREGLILAGHDISAGGLITTLLEMAFPTCKTGFCADLTVPEGLMPNHVLFSEQPGVVIQVRDTDRAESLLLASGLRYHVLGKVTTDGIAALRYEGGELSLSVERMRNLWFKSSWLLDKKQSGEQWADERYRNFASQPLQYRFPKHFKGSFASFGIDPLRETPTGIRAGIIREKGVNGDREMAWSMYLAGFDVRDIHMTDLMSGRETLEDLQFIVFVGGFSNSDVLGSARGWTGAFLFNPAAKEALDRFYTRPDTLSLGVCNGCQLMVALGLLYPDHPRPPVMHHNRSGKFESAFLTIDIEQNHSVMLGSLAGSRLGIWVAHGEGRFELPLPENEYHIPARYTYHAYPGNPNGSDYDAAAICSADGRHLAMMPHLERSVHPWNWAWYNGNAADEVSPWIEAFVNARLWIEKHHKK
ncbi:MAG TPA: phosphoribosylformylglycinamidine synthase [Bacteroidales bacterium]|nr:phosphoribosylformylglycinamidine synthase [Bacteroidales bacterium]